MTTVTFRPDEQAQRDLDELTADGTTASQAIRRALAVAVEARRRDRLRGRVDEALDVLTPQYRDLLDRLGR